MKNQTSVVKAEPSKKENLKLFAIFAFLIFAATILGTLDGFNGLEWIRWFMGGFMIIFGGLKLVGIEVFIKVAPLYDLIAKRFGPYKYLYPLIQVLLGGMYIVAALPILRDLLTIAMALSGLVGMIQVVSKRGPIKLSYLGTILRLRFSTVTIIENTVMVVLGTLMLIGEILR